MSTIQWAVNGWYRINSEGLNVIHLSITDEGFTGSATDAEPFADYKPRIRNPEQFSIRRRPMVWPWGETQKQTTYFGKLEIDNYDGAYDFLLLADMRDSTVVLTAPQAQMFGGNADSPVICTCVLEDATSDNEDVISITLKDIIARLDKPLPMRFNPPFADPAAANRMVPLTLGSCRNVPPLLVDSTGNGTGQPIYQLHDQAITNITAARDMGALLDFNATPPQVVPALNNSGMQLQVPPQGMLLVDCSSKGQQSIIPGAADVLLGVGNILSTGSGGVTTWVAPETTNAPSGWTYTNSGGTSGVFGKFTAANGISQDWGVSMSTKKAYTNTGNGFYMTLNTAQLQPGRTYRISIVIDRAYFPNGDTTGAGLYLTTSPTTRNGGISGSSYGPYLTTPSVNGAPYSFIYKAPNDTTVRAISVVMVGNPGYSSNAQMVWHGLRAELLGQYTDLPQVGITLTDYIAEILQRANDPTITYSATDLQAIDTAAGYLFGNHYDDQPNTLDAIGAPFDSFCAAYFTDAVAQMRFRRLIDPKLGTPVASFDLTNVKRPISVKPDRAQYLTTLMGVRRNWKVPGPSDFVTDYVAVPANVRERYMRTSQYQVYSTKSPASQYANAIGAPELASLLDNVADGQTEIDRVVGIYSPQIYTDGTIFNGKRRFVEFTMFFDDWAHINGPSSPAPQDLLFGDIVVLTYLPHGFNNTPVFVAGTELFPFAQQLTIWGFV